MAVENSRKHRPAKAALWQCKPIPFEISDTNNHRSAWIEWQVLKPKPSIKDAQFVIERMRQNTPASHVFGKPYRCRQSKPHQRARIAKALIAAINRELSQ